MQLEQRDATGAVGCNWSSGMQLEQRDATGAEGYNWSIIIIIIIVVNHNRRQKGDSRVIRQSRVWGKYYLEILIINLQLEQRNATGAEGCNWSSEMHATEDCTSYATNRTRLTSRTDQYQNALY